MLFFEPISLAIRNLRRRKLRTILTAFAVFIGIALLSVMISLGLGVRNWLLKQISSQMEYTRITVSQKGTFSSSGMMGGFASLVSQEEQQAIKIINDLTVADIQKLEHVTQVEPMLMLMPKRLQVAGAEKYLKRAIGVGWDLAPQDSYIKQVFAGDLTDWTAKENPIILTNQTLKAYELKTEDVIGKIVELGVTKNLAGGQMMFQSQTEDEVTYSFTVAAVIDVGLDSNYFIIPVGDAVTILARNLSSTQEYLERVGYPFLYVNTDDMANTKGVAQNIDGLGYQATTVGDIIGMINRIFLVIQAILAIFGLIALFISALGIINTMVMTTYERTKEIGLLKAVGAKKSDIRRIFMTEAGLIGFLGGVFGTAAGYLFNFAASKAVNIFLQKQGESPQDFFSFPFWLIGGSIAFAVVLGILAGLYPANRAANLDPIEALRHE